MLYQLCYAGPYYNAGIIIRYDVPRGALANHKIHRVPITLYSQHQRSQPTGNPDDGTAISLGTARPISARKVDDRMTLGTRARLQGPIDAT